MAKAHTQEAQLRQAEEESARRNVRGIKGGSVSRQSRLTREGTRCQWLVWSRHSGPKPHNERVVPREPRSHRPTAHPRAPREGEGEAQPDPRSPPQAPKVKLSDLPPGVWAEATLGRG